MFKKISSYLLIVTLFTLAFSFTACSNDDDDDLPKVKTAEEIKAENLAEFKELIGATGVSNTKYETAMSMESISELTGDAFDKLAFETREDFPSDEGRFFKFDGKYVYRESQMKIKGDKFTFDKQGDIFTLFASLEDEKVAYFGENIINDGEFEIKVIYNTKTKIITTFYSGYMGGNNTGTVVFRYKAEPYKAKVNKTAKRSLVKRSTTALTGVHYVLAELKPVGWNAYLPAWLLKPKGHHYVKFTAKSNGKTRVQFCDANGNVSGNHYSITPAQNDYYYNTTNHFWKNKMPMTLNLDQVDFTYNSGSGAISQGSGVMARARKNYNPIGVVPPFFGDNLTNQNSGSAATIISTSGNSASSFKLEIKLDFDVKFHCVITK